MIHWEQPAEPVFCALLPISQLATPLLSSAVQILSSCHFKVRCDLGFAPGWCTIKALLGPNKGHTKTAGISSRLTACLSVFCFFYLPSNFFIFVAVSLSLSVYLLALSLFLSLPPRFNFLIVLIIQSKFLPGGYPVCSVSFGWENTSR